MKKQVLGLKVLLKRAGVVGMKASSLHEIHINEKPAGEKGNLERKLPRYQLSSQQLRGEIGSKSPESSSSYFLVIKDGSR